MAMLKAEQFSRLLKEIASLDTQDPATVGMLSLIATLLFEQRDLLGVIARTLHETNDPAGRDWNEQ